MDLTYAIDVFAKFNDRLWLAGWILDHALVAQAVLEGPGLSDGRYLIASHGALDSQDVENHFGERGRGARFSETIAIHPGTFSVKDCKIVVEFRDGRVEEISDLGAPVGQMAPLLTAKFQSLLIDRPPGCLLEVGSRARSGLVRRGLTPAGWTYTGMDVLAGPNVDCVGDAHELSTLLPNQKFDAVMSFSVLEHLLMPWKFVIELNRVLTVGAIGIFTTHQCWPIHDQPWDFWRFSDKAWQGLLNKATGFEIISADMGEPAYVVAQRCHAVTDFNGPAAGFLASNVLFRKIAETDLSWPVGLQEVLSTQYPQGEVNVSADP